MRKISVTGGPESGLIEVRDARTGEFILDYQMLMFFVEAGGTLVATVAEGTPDLEAGDMVFEVCDVDIQELDLKAVLVSRGVFKEVIEG